MFQLQNIIGLGNMRQGNSIISAHKYTWTGDYYKGTWEKPQKRNTYNICRKSSKSYSRKHVFLISCCDVNGFAKCCFCQIHWTNQ